MLFPRLWTDIFSIFSLAATAIIACVKQKTLLVFMK